MRAGILTFHCTNNPGSVLQAYALKQIVRRLGAECDIVNYQRKNWIIEQYSPSVKKRLGVLWPLGWLPALLLLKINYLPYDRFRRKRLLIFPHRKITKRKELMTLQDRYDKWIVGSDQVWNLDNAKVDDSFFLDFVRCDEKKTAYAASFGRNDVAVGCVKNVAELLKHFQFISVRESRGVEIVRTLTGREAEHVLDPTLLLDQTAWDKIAKHPKEDGYILIYLRMRSDIISEAAERLAKATGLPVLAIGSYGYRAKIGKQILCPGPERWLGYFLNAKYVITNSFHGMAFSINFNKQFYAVPVEKVGNQENTSSRIFSLLEQFSLEDRLLTNSLAEFSVDEIDYQRVNEQLKRERKASLDFLRRALYETAV